VIPLSKNSTRKSSREHGSAQPRLVVQPCTPDALTLAALIQTNGSLCAICLLLAINFELAKVHGGGLLQTLLYVLFTLVKILGGYRLKHGE
jgi:hypothetical protein